MFHHQEIWVKIKAVIKTQREKIGLYGKATIMVLCSLLLNHYSLPLSPIFYWSSRKKKQDS